MQNSDVATLEIAGPESIGLPMPTAAQEAEHTVPADVAPVYRYEDPIEEEKLLTVEEFLEISSRDTPSVRAFKCLVNELLSRMNQSKPSACRMRHTSGYSVPDSLPSVADFIADVSLCVKRSCSNSLYVIFGKCVDTQFEIWPRVPESVRNAIAERAGKLMIERGIVRRGKTARYWMSGYMQNGPRTKDTRSIRVA